MSRPCKLCWNSVFHSTRLLNKLYWVFIHNQVLGQTENTKIKKVLVLLSGSLLSSSLHRISMSNTMLLHSMFCCNPKLSHFLMRQTLLRPNSKIKGQVGNGQIGTWHPFLSFSFSLFMNVPLGEGKLHSSFFRHPCS